MFDVGTRMRNETKYLSLAFLHSLVFTILIVVSSTSPSPVTSIIPLTYWIAGLIVIFRKRKESGL